MLEGNYSVIKRTVDSDAIMCTASVIEFEDTFLRVTCGGGNPPVPGSKVYISVFDDVKGELVYSGKVTKRFLENIDISGVKFVKKVQRRDEARVEIMLSVHILSIEVEDMQIDLPDPVECTLLDLSAGGMRIASSMELGKNSAFSCLLHLGNDVDISVPYVKVKRILEDGDACQYGCVFHGIPSKDIKIIRQFVFSKQIEHASKTNGARD